MDVERELRTEIRSALGSGFHTDEEVSLRSIHESCLRADVIAVPKETKFAHLSIAFEVKIASKRNFQKWTHVFKQAADYVGTAISHGAWEGREISASFVYPSPPYTLDGGLLPESLFWREEQGLQLAGVIHMASMFKVGIARSDASGFGLFFSATPLWTSSYGWHKSGKDLLSSKRLGSRKVIY